MPDIMMCDAGDCSKSKVCRRHANSGTRPDQYAQTYWLRDESSPIGDDCGEFWNVGRAALEQGGQS